jgi:diacylglycerol kinase family enzyme
MAVSDFMKTKKICCIVNPQAANKKWEKNALLRRYLQKNFPGEIINIRKNRDYTIETAKKLSQDHDVIVAAGGDGTIAAVIQGIHKSGRGKDIYLGVLPIGSGNGFASSMGIPIGAMRAVKIIKEGFFRWIDLVDIEGVATSSASIGATAKVLQKKLKHNIPGFFGHILAARIMLKLSKKEQEIELFDVLDDEGNKFDQKSVKLKVFDCVIGTTKYFGYKTKISPEAKVDEGYMDITFFQISGVKYILSFPSIYLGLFQKTQKHFKAKKAILRGENLPIQHHGEFLGVKNEVNFKVLPSALKVICPDKKI